MTIYLDAGTTYSKIISKDKIFDDKFCLNNFDGNNYYAVGESAYLLHCTKVAYHYLADKGGKLYTGVMNYINKNSGKLLTQNK